MLTEDITTKIEGILSDLYHFDGNELATSAARNAADALLLFLDVDTAIPGDSEPA